MPRRNWNDGQEITYEDLNAASSAVEKSVLDHLMSHLMQGVTDAFFGTSFKVSYSTPTQVIVAAGIGIQEDGDQESPEPTNRIVRLADAETLTLQAPHASLDRYDIICVKAAIANELSDTRKHKNASTSAITNQSMVIQKDWECEFNQTQGTPHASPSVPATPAGYIKIAEILVTAVSGMSGAGAITDTRHLLPVGDEVLHDTAALTRLTAGGSTRIGTLLSEIDALLKRGNFEYCDFEDLEADPSAPVTADYHRLYMKDGSLYGRKTDGTVVLLSGGGGGGGGGGKWYPVAPDAPEYVEENSFEVYKFGAGLGQKLAFWLKVPSSYISGRQITMEIGQYSPSNSNTQLLQATATLVRQNNDAVTSSANSHASTNSALTNTVASQYRKATLDLTSATGTINSVAVTAGDLIKVELTRGTDTDTDDVRFVPSMTEFKS